jgi:hypothetical protein
MLFVVTASLGAASFWFLRNGGETATATPIVPRYVSYTELADFEFPDQANLERVPVTSAAQVADELREQDIDGVILDSETINEFSDATLRDWFVGGKVIIAFDVQWETLVRLIGASAAFNDRPTNERPELLLRPPQAPTGELADARSSGQQLWAFAFRTPPNEIGFMWGVGTSPYYGPEHLARRLREYALATDGLVERDGKVIPAWSN